LLKEWDRKHFDQVKDAVMCWLKNFQPSAITHTDVLKSKCCTRLSAFDFVSVAGNPSRIMYHIAFLKVEVKLFLKHSSPTTVFLGRLMNANFLGHLMNTKTTIILGQSEYL
jgi:hypothetical protein